MRLLRRAKALLAMTDVDGLLAMTRGFTMIETMVVATIFSIVALGLGTTFLSGMRIWDRARQAGFERYGLVLDMETIASDLRHSVNAAEIGFEGGQQGFSFPMISGASIVKVSYRFDPVTKTLLRKQVDIRDISESEAEEDEKAVQKKFLNWEAFSVKYFKVEKVTVTKSDSHFFLDKEGEEWQWKEGWEKEDGAFYAVRMEVGFKGEQFVKTVFIPAS